MGVGEWYGIKYSDSFAGLHCTDESQQPKTSIRCLQFAKIDAIQREHLIDM